MLGTDDAPTVRLTRPVDIGSPTDQLSGIGPLLFGLSLAAALPPTAILLPPTAALPIVRSDPHVMFSPDEVAALLGCPTTLVGRGRIALGEVDCRMEGLVVALEVFQVMDGGGTLVSLGVVTPRWAYSAEGSVKTADLWTLAREALERYGIATQWSVRIGDVGRLVVYGGITAQVAWLTGDRLATASVTCLDGNEAWAVQAAGAIAVSLDRRLPWTGQGLGQGDFDYHSAGESA